MRFVAKAGKCKLRGNMVQAKVRVMCRHHYVSGLLYHGLMIGDRSWLLWQGKVLTNLGVYGGSLRVSKWLSKAT